MASKFDGLHKRILVLGLGVSGRSAARFVIRKGGIVTGVDRNASKLQEDKEIIELCAQGMKVISDSEALDININQFDLVVVSPGVSPSHAIYAKAQKAGIEVIGEVELACRSIEQKCLAITGTNGKTTVALMAAHVLNYAGIPARALGNIGTPLTSVCDQLKVSDNEVFVIELSSFQLDTLKSRFIDAAVILNITPDHLDRYGTLAMYARSKIQISHCLKNDGKLFVWEKCMREFLDLFAPFSVQLYGYDKKCFISCDTKAVSVDNKEAFALPSSIYGKRNHDVENTMASYALCRHAGVTNKQFHEAIQRFKKPSHRIEFVRTLRGVHYYDDSKGTNLDAVICAVKSLDGNIVLIAGGVDKGAPYTVWLESVAQKLKYICAIGKAKEKIKSDLGDHIPVELFETLDDAVIHAASVSKAGDTVLLSPGCASYDMFRDYAHRGQEFQRIVNALHAGIESA